MYALCVVSGLVSDAFHLTFGCGLLSFSLFAMAASRQKPDRTYTYGYVFLTGLFLMKLQKGFIMTLESYIINGWLSPHSFSSRYIIYS